MRGIIYLIAGVLVVNTPCDARHNTLDSGRAAHVLQSVLNQQLTAGLSAKAAGASERLVGESYYISSQFTNGPDQMDTFHYTYSGTNGSSINMDALFDWPDTHLLSYYDNSCAHHLYAGVQFGFPIPTAATLFYDTAMKVDMLNNVVYRSGKHYSGGRISEYNYSEDYGNLRARATFQFTYDGLGQPTLVVRKVDTTIGGNGPMLKYYANYISYTNGRQTFDSSYSFFYPIGPRIINRYTYDAGGKLTSWLLWDYYIGGYTLYKYDFLYDNVNRVTSLKRSMWLPTSNTFALAEQKNLRYTGSSRSYMYAEDVLYNANTSSWDTSYRTYLTLNAAGAPMKRIAIEPYQQGMWDTVYLDNYSYNSFGHLARKYTTNYQLRMPNSSNANIPLPNNFEIITFYYEPYQTAGIEKAEKTLVSMTSLPNPATVRTTLLITLAEARNLSISLNDITGKEVYSLTLRPFPAGTHEHSIPMETLPPGSYFCRLIGTDGITLAASRVIRQ